MIEKDANYWKEYNQKRREYIQQKNKERYLKNKEINTTDNNTTISQVELKKDTTKEKLIQPSNQVEINTTESQVELIQPKKVVDKVETINTTKPKKLWKDFYTGLKPHCRTCLEKGITSDQYAFCSPEKQPLPIYGENGKLIHTFSNIYACQTYHWTKFQRQDQLRPRISKISCENLTKNYPYQQNYTTYQNSIKL